MRCNLEVLLESPQILIQEMTARYTVFTRDHIEAEIFKRVAGDDKLFEILKERIQFLDLTNSEGSQRAMSKHLAEAWLKDKDLFQTQTMVQNYEPHRPFMRLLGLGRETLERALQVCVLRRCCPKKKRFSKS